MDSYAVILRGSTGPDDGCLDVNVGALCTGWDGVCLVGGGERGVVGGAAE